MAKKTNFNKTSMPPPTSMTMQQKCSQIVNDYLANYKSKCYGVEGEIKAIQDMYHKAQAGAVPMNDFWRRCIKGGHQRRMLNTNVIVVKNLLQENNLLTRHYATFEDLYNDVNSIIGDVKGIGLLTVYDISLRIGVLFQKMLRPNMVYLNRGAYQGAKNLLGKAPGKIANPSVFAPFFGNIDPIYIEDILCIYKDCLVDGGKISVKNCGPATSICSKRPNIIHK